ncbi:MAG: HEAT repeat domain-containing protein [Candidatus Thorarchaeota archaeon]
MSDKDDESKSSAQESSGTGRRLRRGKKDAKKEPSFVDKMLKSLSSIQACKDAAMTGTDDFRLLAVCRLGEYGAEAFEALDIALIDDNPTVRTVAAGMLASSEDKDAIDILEPYLSDEDESVREAIEYSLSWLKGRATERDHGTQIPSDWENPVQMLLESEAVPLRTSDDVEIVSTFSAIPESLEFGMMMQNFGDEPIHDITVKILLYPYESLEPAESLMQVIDIIEPDGIEALIFGFNVIKECVEGEFVTSVQFVDEQGEHIAAKSGNIFVRSLFEQFSPLEITPEDFLSLKSELKEWNREHSLEVEAEALFETVKELFEDWNLGSFQSERTERDDMYMGVISGMAKGRITGIQLAVTLTVVGKLKDALAKLRIDVLCEDPEVLHTIASVIFETIQRKLGVFETED